ncbi:hypothetical protein [Acetobacterium paludosum]|uniref:hypothetical protein n=1 Tax=Acetobacterium paludosum TaxID=52693 RepID=UPI0011E05C59|nr:hypothetical protein [Acetobacterium paludosum]
MIDIDGLSSIETVNRPTFLLAHNPFGNINEEQQSRIKDYIRINNVHAYFCGDTHLSGVTQITYEDDQNKQIPCITCYCSTPNPRDTYSEFGVIVGEWEGDSDKAVLNGWKWKSGIGFEPDEKIWKRSIFMGMPENKSPFGRKKSEFEICIDSLKKPSLEGISDLDYRSKKMPFTGREGEMKVLMDFLNDDRQFLWWAIIASGGTGKSRLVLEFIESNMMMVSWKMLFLQDAFFISYNKSNWFDWSYPDNLLLVVDYVQIRSQIIAEFITGLASSCTLSKKIRILLIEREADESALWYKNNFDTTVIKGTRYKEFYKLKTINDEKLKKLASNYLLENYSKQINENELNSVLTQLAEVDPEKRILFLMMILDARNENTEKWRNWDKNQLSDYIVKRELQNIKNRFAGLTEDIYKAYNRLLCFATMTEMLNLEDPPVDLPVFLQKDCERLSNAFAFNSELMALLQENELVIRPYTPDILGEYLSLVLFQEVFRSQSEKEAVIEAAQKIGGQNYYIFLGRCFNDGMNCAENFKKLFNEKWFFITPDSNENKILLSVCLYILIFDQDPAAAMETVKRLENLSSENRGIEEIKIYLAESLAVQALDQDPAAAMETVKRLENLSSENPGIEKIKICLAEGLAGLIRNQDPVAAAEVVERLENLSSKNPGIEEIKACLAEILVLQRLQQDLGVTAETVKRLENLSSENPENERIKMVLAEGLAKLTRHQDLAATAETVKRLENLSNENPENERIKMALFEGLARLTRHQDPVAAMETVERLENLNSENPENESIKRALAEGLAGLTRHQDLAAAMETVERLGNLSSENPEVQEIKLTLANCLVKLALDQELPAAVEAVERLENLSNENPGIEDMKIFLTLGLVGLTINQDPAAAMETVERLENLSSENPGIEKIKIYLAESLAGLTHHQDPVAAMETVERLENLNSENPGIEDMKIFLTLGLVGLTINQDPAAAMETVERLENLSSENPGIEEIKIYLAESLARLTRHQDPVAAMETVERLENLSSENPGIEKIKTLLAESLARLTPHL